jgi:two-component system, cell cycle response regulator
MSLDNQQKILLIDDNPAAYDLLQRMVRSFERGSWELEYAETYAVGLKKLLTGRYAVCLLDYHLDEGRDGLHLLREAALAECTTPVIFLTADPNPALDEEALQAGAVDFLVKAEFTPVILERSVRYARRLGEMVSQLRRQATRDKLTGLHNRREFDRLLDEEVHRSARFKHTFALVILDIDHFKKINDTYGHQVGDEVLKHVASLFAGQIRIVDRIARYGGEEFGLIMIETARADARDTIDRLRALLAETPCVIADKNLSIDVTVSAGVAAMPDDAETAEQLIAAADEALYTAKKLGRNRVVTTKKRSSKPPWQSTPHPHQEPAAEH